jgi:hypothetical protein
MVSVRLLFCSLPPYNPGGQFGVACCVDLAGCDGNLCRESTDGNERTDPQRGQRRKFARWCSERSRDAALYRCGERGSEAPDPDQESPACSCDRETTIPGYASQRPGGAFVARRNTAESATLADQNPATLLVLSLFPHGNCITDQRRRANAPIWQGCEPNQKVSANRTLQGGAK